MADQEYETGYELRERELIVRLPREVDHHSSQGIREVTEYCARERKIRKIIFDFSLVHIENTVHKIDEITQPMFCNNNGLTLFFPQSNYF